MFTKKVLKGIAVIATSSILSLSTIQSAYAAPGTLATAPLFLSTLVEPNIFFTIDDSGSMAWEIMAEATTVDITSSTASVITSDGGIPKRSETSTNYYTFLHPGPHRSSATYTNIYGANSKYGGILPQEGTYTLRYNNKPVNVDYDKFWVFKNHVGNKLYYNPNTKYKPWPGNNADGTPMFTDADPKNAVQDPVHGTGVTTDLTRRFDKADFPENSNSGIQYDNMYLPTYYNWTDTNDNKIIDAGDTRTKVEITTSEDDAKQLQNFANWWVYYRSRINTTKAAIGSVINKTDAARMGQYLFNGPEGSEAGTVQSVALASMSDPVKKRAFLTAFYGVKIHANGTPSRTALDTVGKKFQSPGGGDETILPASQGGECQQNFNIFMSDGFYNSSQPSNIGNRDKEGGDGDTGFDGNVGESNDQGNYADEYSDTLADVAMKYYESDLRTGMTDKVPTSIGVDEASHQHLVNFMIAFGIKGQQVTATTDPTVTEPAFTWPEPVINTNSTVDDMFHAAYNSRGKYLNAQNPKAFEKSLNDAVSDIASRTATAAAVSINSARLTTEALVFLAQFNTNRWEGDLFAFKIDDPITGRLESIPEWQAAKLLDKRKINKDKRNIMTYVDNKGVEFKWNKLKDEQRDDFRTDPNGNFEPDDDKEAKARLSYLLGARGNEGKGFFFRSRSSRLGDLVNSGPVYVGAPALNWPDEAPFPDSSPNRYSDFKEAQKNRTGVVYVGSNDGFLHGFNASADVNNDGGREVFAYAPGNLFSTDVDSGYHYLSNPAYQHRYYNDLTPTIADIYANLGDGGTKWNSILISGQRGGGRGIYALNVTDPDDFEDIPGNADDIALWEFTNADSENLGYTFSRPQIALANNGRWVAIFGNGYNDEGSGESSLFILDIAKGKNDDWDDAGAVVEIQTGVGDADDRNGLATPALADLDGNGTVDRVYAGDLKGNMWSFDLSATDASAWSTAGSKKLFTTIGSQPITVKPSLAKHPSVQDETSNHPNVMVFFGSGQYLTDADKSTTTSQYFYGVWDKGTVGRNVANLVEQTYDSNFPTQRVLSKNAVNYNDKFGWYFELPASGERSVTNSVVRGDLVFFNSFAPNTDPCSVGGGGYRFAVDLETGGSPDEATFDVNLDGMVDENDNTNNNNSEGVIAALQQDGFLPEPVFIEDIAYTAETPTKVKGLKELPKGRFAWQELIQ